MANLALPGNPRYQPKGLVDYFGYDNLCRGVASVEIAAMRTLAEIGVIPVGDIALLTPSLEEALLGITTTEVYRVENEETVEFGKPTKHDIRAWVRIAQSKLPAQLRRWVHVPLTSYDALDTGRAIQFSTTHVRVVRPSAQKLIGIFADRIEEYAKTIQIGRTHGQHALPITFGFWLSTITSRIMFNVEQADVFAAGLVGNDLYESVEEKAAHLLYFIIKNHPFTDGNKRSGAFAFVWFLKKAKILDTKRLTPEALTALALLVAESDPKEKERVVGLVLMLLRK